MIIEQTVTFPADHPAFEGHFPGNPIVPGVCLLNRAAALARNEAQITVTGVKRAKFKASLRPDIDCVMRLTQKDDGSLELLCHVGEELILQALFDCAPPPKRS